jgi:hypothetical protein
LSEKDGTDLSCVAIHLLNTVTEFANIPKLEIFKTGSLSMAIYSSCSRDLTDQLASVQFDVVIRFVTWTLGTFTTGPMSQGLRPKATVAKICREGYAKFDETIRPGTYLSEHPELAKMQSFEFDEHLSSVADNLIGICRAYRNGL